MTPSVDGQVHWFQEQGLYDGLFLMRDDESGTFWDHMTGEAVYGPLTGRQLAVTNIFQTTVGQVLDQNPSVRVALSDRILWEERQLTLRGLVSSMGNRLSRMFQSTVEAEDDRRPTMDLGMGLWEGEQSRYYPYETVVESGNAVLDGFAGRPVVVFLDPSAYSLSAFFVESETFEWDGDILRFGDGTYVENGRMLGADGLPLDAPRPLQIFTRWYGFSLTFPGTEIYGER